VLQRIVGLYRGIAEETGGRPHTLGICTPGSISTKTGLLKNCNATQLNGHPLQADLKAGFARDFALDNDANCFAMAEACGGAGVGFGSVLGLVMGTGVGAGIVIDGKLLGGRHGIAGEWGHMSVDPAGPVCYCGRRGCVERYLSGQALESAYLRATGDMPGLAAIVERARGGEGAAAELLDRFLDDFAAAVASVVAVLDPEVIVLGGGLASIEELYADGAARLSRLVFNDAFDTPLVRNRLGNASGVIGAALIGI